MSKDLRYTSAPSQGAFLALSKPIRTVLVWQLAVTAVAALLAALLADVHSAISAGLGGLVSIIAGVASALVASLNKARSAGGVLVGALRAEAVKIGLALLLLWLVLMNYGQVAIGVLLGTFIVTIVIFSMAFFVRDY